MDKRGLLAAMRTGRERFQVAMVSLDEEAFTMAGGYSPNSDWSYKDLLAHIGYWEERVTTIFTYLLDGKEPPEDNRPLDDINQDIYARTHHLTAAEVREQEAVAYQRLLGLVERASEADLFDPKHYSWTGGLPFADWIAGNSYEHYQEHRIGN
jgi:hypothetical protein